MNYDELIERQRAYYRSGATRGYAFRMQALEKLQAALKKYDAALKDALLADLNKQPMESHTTEIGLVYDEIRLHRKNLKKWMRDRKVRTSQLYLPGTRSYRSPEPMGVVLIISPWNYPVNLTLLPLIGAISAGNCAVIKTSSKAPHVGAVLGELIADAFDDEYITTVHAARSECGNLLLGDWDHIFFTGSQKGGREVMAAAAQKLVPVSLELGGKNPVVIDPTADLRAAARRIAYGKTMNAGQTCVAPDYLLIHESIRDAFMLEYREALKKFFPKDDMSQMPCIVNDEAFRRLCGYIVPEKTSVGGRFDENRRFIEPTVLVDVQPEDAIMQEEVFGPILPVLTWTELEQCPAFIHRYPKPLAMYIFSKDQAIIRRLLNECSFGGGCVNDTVVHVSNSSLPFGGVGASGIGSYHGEMSFEAFTHFRSIADHRGGIENPIRYFPYTKAGYSLIRKFMK